MTSRNWDRIVYGTVVVLFVGLLVYCKIRSSQKSESLETVDSHITHADTYYWFAMMGRGSMAALSSGQTQIDLARRKLDLEREDTQRADTGSLVLEQAPDTCTLIHIQAGRHGRRRTYCMAAPGSVGRHSGASPTDAG